MIYYYRPSEIHYEPMPKSFANAYYCENHEDGYSYFSKNHSLVQVF